MSENNLNIYGSLSYYTLMPFAAISNFDPLSPAVGTAFYSVIFILLSSFLLNKFFKWKWLVALTFLIPLFPFLQSGRWAWNPHFIPFWQVLSLFPLLLAFQKSRWYLWILSGFLLGLTVHNHWYAIFSLGGLTLAILIWTIRNHKFFNFLYFSLGTFLSLLPFLLFDFKNPPGLFFTRFLYFGPYASNSSTELPTLLLRIPAFFQNLSFYFFQNRNFSFVVSLVVFVYIVFVLVKSHSLLKKLLLLPIFTQILGLSLTGPHSFDHYLLPAALYFVLILAIPDFKQKFSRFQITLMVLLSVLSLLPAYQEITKDTWMTNINRTKKITTIIKQNINGQKCNVYAGPSPDQNTVGKRYRDLLKVQGVHISEKEYYRDYQCLFVVTTTNNLLEIQNDPAYELDLIRHQPLVQKWTIESSGWFVFKFEAPQTK